MKYLTAQCQLINPSFLKKWLNSLQDHWTSITSPLPPPPPTFSKKVQIITPLEVSAFGTIACWFLHSSVTYFWRNMNTSNIFYFSNNTQYSGLWETIQILWLLHDKTRKFHDISTQPCKTEGPALVHQNITGNITVYVGPGLPKRTCVAQQ